MIVLGTNHQTAPAIEKVGQQPLTPRTWSLPCGAGKPDNCCIVGDLFDLFGFRKTIPSIPLVIANVECRQRIGVIGAYISFISTAVIINQQDAREGAYSERGCG